MTTTKDINMTTTKDTTMVTMTKANIDNHHMNQIHILIAITWNTAMTVTAMVMIHMAHNNHHIMTNNNNNQTMVTVAAVKALMAIIVSTKPRIKNMSVEQVYLKDSLQVQ